jgi:hypothetical protein
MDRAVSSYTATVRAMAYPRNHQPVSTAAANPSMLVVAVPNAPHARPLPGVSREADLLQQLIPAIERLDGPSDCQHTADSRCPAAFRRRWLAGGSSIPAAD